MSTDSNDHGTGYQRPPKSGQFRKGVSGNPRGRPRKPAQEPQPSEARFPTRELLRQEAAREVVVNDPSGRHRITARQAVLRATLHKAMQGSVVAQRTALRAMAVEDEIYHRERKEAFDWWHEHASRARRAIEAAIRKGETPPEFLPHPDDMRFNWERLEVRFLGAMDAEQRASERRIETIRDLSFEMSVYLGEDNRLPDARDPEGRLGLFMLMHLCAINILPPRLRRFPEGFHEQMQAHAALGLRHWGCNLQRRCRAAEFPFWWHNPKRVQ